MTKRIAYMSMLTALAAIFGYVEVLIPFSFGIPGIKLGLANLVIVIGLYMLSARQVFGILIARIVLLAFLFGNMSSLLYSLAGGGLSFLVMLLLRKQKGFSVVGVSMAGGVSHNIGQVMIAACVVESRYVFGYLPILMVAGLVTGILIGVVASRVLPVIQSGYRRENEK